jgi:hypothetical protein
VPAAAVTPAPIAYINVVAVKKLVVGFSDDGGVRAHRLGNLLNQSWELLVTRITIILCTRKRFGGGSPLN